MSISLCNSHHASGPYDFLHVSDQLDKLPISLIELPVAMNGPIIGVKWSRSSGSVYVSNQKVVIVYKADSYPIWCFDTRVWTRKVHSGSFSRHWCNWKTCFSCRIWWYLPPPPPPPDNLMITPYDQNPSYGPEHRWIHSVPFGFR
jgi:hypothetical protein